jgi:homoserine kinase type II
MASVFVLQHVHSQANGVEDVKFIGVYSSREKAEAAVARLSCQPGFSDAPDGFHVDEYRVDQDCWVEGYVTVASA